MSVITLPAEFRPSSVALRLAVSQRVSASPFGGSEEAVDLLNDRWLMSCELPARRMANGAWLEAFIGALRGQSNTVPLYHFARPAPLGTIRGNLTLSAAAAQGASSLFVTGCQTAYSTVKAGDMFSVGGLLVQAASDAVSGGVNLLPHSQTLAGWMSSGLSSLDQNAAVAPDGTTTAILYTSDYDDSGFWYGPVCTINSTYTCSTHFKSTGSAGWIRIGVDTDGTIINKETLEILGYGSAVAAVVSIGDGWHRFIVTFTAYSPNFICYASVGSVYIWGVQLEAGAGASAYTPTTTRAIGDVTIPITNRLRVAQPSGAAVTWDKPTFNARMLDTSGVQYRSAVTEPVSFDFGEAI